LRRGHFFEQLPGKVLDDARMAKVNAHPIDGTRDICVLRSNFLGRCIILRVPGQKIVVSFIP